MSYSSRDIIVKNYRMAHETRFNVYGLSSFCWLWKEEHHVRTEEDLGVSALDPEGSAGRQACPVLVLQQLGLSVVQRGKRVSRKIVLWGVASSQ